jgi:hypothetical protein
LKGSSGSRTTPPYQRGKPTWLKIKNPDYSRPEAISGFRKEQRIQLACDDVISGALTLAQQHDCAPSAWFTDRGHAADGKTAVG